MHKKELNIRNDSLERTNNTLKKQLTETNKTIKKLVNTINILKSDNQKLNDNNKENNNKINSIINELNDLNINKNSFLSQLKEKKEEEEKNKNDIIQNENIDNLQMGYQTQEAWKMKEDFKPLLMPINSREVFIKLEHSFSKKKLL